MKCGTSFLLFGSLMVMSSRSKEERHRLTVVSLLAVAMVRPSGENARLLIPAVWPASGPIFCSVREVTRHSIAVPSALAAARSSALGEKLIAVTRGCCVTSSVEGKAANAGEDAISRHEPTSHSFTVPSLLPVARVLLSGEKATAVTAFA